MSHSNALPICWCISPHSIYVLYLLCIHMIICQILVLFWLMKVYFKYGLLTIRIKRAKYILYECTYNELQSSKHLPLKEPHFSILPSPNNHYHVFVITEKTKTCYLSRDLLIRRTHLFVMVCTWSGTGLFQSISIPKKTPDILERVPSVSKSANPAQLPVGGRSSCHIQGCGKSCIISHHSLRTTEYYIQSEAQ